MTSENLDCNEGGLFSNPEFSEARRVPHCRFFDFTTIRNLPCSIGLESCLLQSELELDGIVYSIYGLTYNPYNIHIIYGISINLQRGTLLASQISGLENTPGVLQSRIFSENLDEVKA